MRSADSGSISSEDSIVLHMLDWWISNHAETIRSVIASALPRGCSSFNVAEIGRCILEQWDGWEVTLLGDLMGNPLGAYMWKAAENGWLRKEETPNTSWKFEFASRVGVMAKDVGWVNRHRGEIKKNQRAVRAVKKVHEV